MSFSVVSAILVGGAGHDIGPPRVAEADSSPPTPFRSSETPESASAMEAACSASEASPDATFAS